MNPNYRYFATYDGEQVVVDKSENPDVSWYEHKAAREVVLADPKDIVIPAADLPHVVQNPHNPQEWDMEDGDTYWFKDQEDAERTLRNNAAVVQAMRLAEKQKREAKTAEVKQKVIDTTNVLLDHVTGHLTEIADIEALSQRLVQAGYKIVKEDA